MLGTGVGEWLRRQRRIRVRSEALTAVFLGAIIAAESTKDADLRNARGQGANIFFSDIFFSSRSADKYSLMPYLSAEGC